ncbi:hypothetical protein HDU91_002238 [Kappamyces sp. JEL0680]|nr:hypothetical protein HDU91_002238 [Kappamyces sp. JEL0680]
MPPHRSARRTQKPRDKRQNVADSPNAGPSADAVNAGALQGQSGPQNPYYTELLNLLVRAIKLECPYSPRRELANRKSAARSSHHCFAIALNSNGRLACPCSGCDKDFLNYPGIKYHIEKGGHEVDVFEKGSLGQTPEMAALQEQIKEVQLTVPTEYFPIEIQCHVNAPDKKYSLPVLFSFSFISGTRDLELEQHTRYSVEQSNPESETLPAAGLPHARDSKSTPSRRAAKHAANRLSEAFQVETTAANQNDSQSEFESEKESLHDSISTDELDSASATSAESSTDGGIESPSREAGQPAKVATDVQTNTNYRDLVRVLTDGIRMEWTPNEDVPSPAGNAEKATMVPLQPNGRLGCPFAACSKDFLNPAGLRYHLSVVGHDFGVFSSNNACAKEIQQLSSLVSESAFPIELPWLFQFSGPQKPSLINLRLTARGSTERLGSASLDDYAARKKPQQSKRTLPRVKAKDMPLFVPRLRKNYPCESIPALPPNPSFRAHFTKMYTRCTRLDFERQFAAVHTPMEISCRLSDKTVQTLTVQFGEAVYVGRADAVTVDHHEKTRAFINSGLAVRTLDWAPHNDSGIVRGLTVDVQFLALSGYADKTTYRDGICEPGPGFIQIWSSDSRGRDLSLRLVVIHPFGGCFDLKWCPNAAFDEQKRIGFLAGTFSDGSLRVFDIPVCGERKGCQYGTNQTADPPVVCNVSSFLCTGVLPNNTIFKLTWSPSNLIATACSNGTDDWRLTAGHVAVWDVSDILQSASYGCIDPILYVPVHSSPVRSICFCPDGTTHSLVTGGADGLTCVTDLRDPFLQRILNRTQGIVTDISYNAKLQLICIADSDFAVRGSTLDDQHQLMLARHSATIWAAHVSRFYPFLLTASSDGSLCITNILAAFYKGVVVEMHPVFRISNTGGTLCFDERSSKSVSR